MNSEIQPLQQKKEARVPIPKIPRLQRIKKGFGRDKYLYFLLVPFISWYLVFLYLPMYGLQIAFKDYSIFQGIAASPWVGLENFVTFFESDYFYRTLKNTVLISLYTLLFAFPAPIILALLFNEIRSVTYKKFAQTFTYLPHFISIVVVAGIVANFLSPSNGLVNIILDKLGMDKIYFLTEPDYFRSIFVGMNIWKDVGFNAIIYIAAISGINPLLYEAAKMDGANRWKQMLHITLPGLIPTILILFILNIGSFLEVGYEAIILLYQPATYETADVINTYVYRAGLQGGEYEIGAAAGLFNAVVGLILVVTANKITKKFSENGGLW
ncbi:MULTISPECIES: ABC transporter permease [Bacillaceae]|uniref:ABC transporter permease n=1 Tax=Bacillaceae TaxID=186817 RepID=UPI000C78747E|nr:MULTISPECIES: ABC transporter permease subunit [Bacillaceae]PLR68803.1 sugar ABC transporter permease [Bacillus sp. UMB0893]QNG58411.1 sugar ABC transporter permease [Bacillus sp. PAMC26568]